MRAAIAWLLLVATPSSAAPVILRETRQLQLGGGICQTASTLFTAALLRGSRSRSAMKHPTTHPSEAIE
jgi:hypothetical protein